MRLSIANPLPDRSSISLLGWLLAIAATGLILSQPFPINLALIPAIALGIAYLLRPVLAPILLVASVPIQTVGAITLGGIELTATKAALAAAAATFLICVMTRHDSLRWSSIMIPYAAYLLAMALSLRHAEALGPALAEMYRWGVTFFAFFLVLYAVRSRRAVLALVSVIGLGALAEALFGAVQAMLGIGPASFAVSAGLLRAYGTFGKPNTYAAYLEVSAPLLLAVALWSGAETLRIGRHYRLSRSRGMLASRDERHELIKMILLTVWTGGTGLAALAGIALSFSRGGWLGITTGLVAMVVIAKHSAPLLRAGVIFALVFIIALGGTGYAPAPLASRFEQIVSQVRLFDSRDVMVTDSNFAAVERMANWQAGAAMFNAEPVTGIGVGNYNTRYREFQIHSGFPVSAGHAHNYYIQAAAETGIIGLAAYLWLIGTALAICIRAARTATDHLGQAIGIGAVGVTVAVMVHNVVENVHVLNIGIQLAAIWALAVLALQNPPWLTTQRT